ncbi:aminotransferase class V-fold PLP-dependent enzyme, partial [Limnoraphis robusta CCNP1324]|uniref:aminotransferase class V-fold PLP-dependent enzyme n=1 Tax=Limnoraphis robusta TaxID=1118279 RepID=UPI002B212437
IMRFMHQADPTQFVPYESPVCYSGPYWDLEEILAIVKSTLTGKWLTAGENVHKFEAEFSRRFQAGKSVMVNSGSSANLAMVGAVKKTFGWEDEDELILSVVGFPTTLAPILQHKLKPVFVDIELDTLNFDLEKIEAVLTNRTRAIFLSPVLGNPPNMDRLLEICHQHQVMLLLDNCDSLGSRWRGRFLNEYAVASSCSFYPAHHICTGEGGMVSSATEEIVTTARSLAWWGRDCYCVGAANLLPCGTCGKRFDNWLPDYDGVVDHRYVFTNIGYNLKPLDLQGAVGVAQLAKFEEIHQRRRESKARI